MTVKTQKPIDDQSQIAEDWHPSEVIAALNKKGYTLALLGKEHGLKSGDTLSKTLTRSYPLGERRIADAIGMHPMVIWPSRYNTDGSRKTVGYHNLYSTRRVPNLQAKAAGESL